MIQVTGVCKGIKTVGQGDSARHFVGLADVKRNGYPGEMIYHEVKLTAAQLQANLHSKLNSLIEKVITLPVFIASRSYQDKAYVDLILDGEPVVHAKA